MSIHYCNVKNDVEWAVSSRNGGAESPPRGSSVHNCRSAVYPLVSNLAMSFTSWWVMAGARGKLVMVVNPLDSWQLVIAEFNAGGFNSQQPH
ncbi:Uncharacterized protein HZ326_2225 [Fusarium oxysporum f. sp. albedinis]|nr:Uncharacterized protein HZ326_2225 [Fusarium oxysporum f. sp. albedinis]